ncbi:GntR family transcriptional regulator [Streptomyces sp. NPDC059447]|uniref:GntR family transcriptional regulator n=1 Tax=Streptomyces sp. NPDC059447 TaxID=3346834 RepID=UPI003681CFC7
MPAQRWRELADRLAARIESGEFPAGAKMPTTKELLAAGESKPSVERAYRELVELGLVVRKPRVGTVVRSRVPVRVPLSRYGAVLRPGGDKGPWETAVAAVGLAGSVVPLTVERVPVPGDVAALLGLEPGQLVVRRPRHALIDGDVVQLQEAFYPTAVAAAAGLDEPGKAVGGVLAALIAGGLEPVSADEKVTARPPTKEEAAELGIGERVPVLCVERVVRDREGRVLEVLRVVGAADRLELHYDNLTLAGGLP